MHISQTTTHLTLSNHRDHILARIGYKRSRHRVQPGLYSIGMPHRDSPVFVSANYTLSFDALRSSLTGMDAYLLVLDTHGINVWCAAGKGTFGTNEVINKVEETGLKDIVDHRVLILPQLGAPGVSAHEVKKRSGFRVEFGPVRAVDIPEYMKTRQATPEMRRVHFSLSDRLALAPVEVTHLLLPLILVSAVLWFLFGPLPAAGFASAILAGILLFPALLPWLPTQQFSSKGFILGYIMAVFFALLAWLNGSQYLLWQRITWSLVYLFTLPPIVAYIALNFTGSSTFTSRTGVRREIFKYIPLMAWSLGIGLLILIGLTVVKFINI